MNVLFLSLVNFPTIENFRGIYADLLRVFVCKGHTVYAIGPNESRKGEPTHLSVENGAYLLNVRVGNITKTPNMLEKGLSMLRIAGQYKSAIQTYMPDVRFDLIIYATPPNTWSNVVEYFKRRDGAKSYLLLKDILPDAAVNLGALSKSGVKGIAYRYLRYCERRLYAISDYIGCMSKANVDYILRHNPDISAKRVEICPNSVEIIDKSVKDRERARVRLKFGIPLDKTVFIYGGNLGRPQGIDFILKCIERVGNGNTYFLIVGDGTEYEKVSRFMNKVRPRNVQLMKRLPKDEYDTMIGACDVGLIFLDYRFQVPQFPSRLLSYMQARLPVLACTDPNTDVGQVIVEGGFGWWCPSNDIDGFVKTVQEALKADRKAMGENAWHYLCEHYDVEIAYRTIISHFE